MKILVAGDVEGRFEQLFTKVGSILKKSGQFDMLLCVGTFFSTGDDCKTQWQKLINGEVKAPLPTYVMGPTSKDHVSFYGSSDCDGNELCENITFLGQAGVFTATDGLQLAYLSGRYSEQDYTVSTENKSLREHFNQSDVDRLTAHTQKKDYIGVDIFLSSDWPSDITIGTTPPDGVDFSRVGSKAVACLAAALKPRYHFVALQKVFYERTPYRNHRVLQEAPQHCTRFISLANVSNPDKKQRFLYAFNITPLSSMSSSELTAQPQSSTDCPYATNLVTSHHQPQATSDHPQNFFYDERSVANSKRKQQHQRGNNPKRYASGPNKGKPPVPKGPCWFCLGSPEVDKHLVVSVGEQSYLALPKGGLTPEHVLILPINHYASFTEASKEAMIEMEKYKSSLRKYFHSKGQNCVIYERNYRSQHMQLQVVPVPKVSADDLREAFVSHGHLLGIEFTELPPGTSVVDAMQAGRPYFHVDFEDPPNLLYSIRGNFPLQFGREVLAGRSVLNMPDRVDWKACSVSKEEETKLANRFRENFEPFDFTADL